MGTLQSSNENVPSNLLEKQSTPLLEALANEYLIDQFKEKIARNRICSEIDISAERAAWLGSLGDRTKTGYKNALRRIELWLSVKGLGVLDLTPGLAQSFVTELRLGPQQMSSVRVTISAISSWYTWLERAHRGFENPFRHIGKLNVSSKGKRVTPPSLEEILKTIEWLTGPLRLAVILLAYRGTPLGALPQLMVVGGSFESIFKGRKIAGTIPVDHLEDVAALGCKPFDGLSTLQLSSAIHHALKKAFSQGLVKTQYSARSMIDHFVVESCKKPVDLYELCRTLGHSSVIITERYLGRLGVGTGH